VIRVLFLCLGNICRSPMAEAVFRKMVKDEGLDDKIEIDSAGLGGWHVGERPHRGTLEVLNKHGVDHAGIRARQFTKQDIQAFDYIVAMDEDNMSGLARLGVKKGPRVFKLLDLVPDERDSDVPDPYYTGNFDLVYELVHKGCAVLLKKIKEEYNL
jgi:protein-tyrosine phosphatase